MKTYLGAIFDLDGTLLNTIADIGNSMNVVLEEMQLPTHTLDAYNFKVGGGFGLLIERSMPENTSKLQKEQALQRLTEVYDAHHTDESTPYDGIISLLSTLQENNIPIAINTNKRDDYAKELAQHFFPTIKFVDVIGQQEVYGTKPNPAAALALANKMNLALDGLLFVGDTDVDMKTGENAGIDTIGVTWGFRPESELRANGATYIVNTATEIQDIILKGSR